MLALLPRLSRLLSPSSIHHALLSFITSDFAKQAKGIAALKRHQRTTAMAMSASTNLLSILCRVPCLLLCPMIRTRVGVMAMGGRIWGLRQELRVQKRQILPRQAGIGRRDLRWSGRGTVKCMPSAIVWSDWGRMDVSYIIQSTLEVVSPMKSMELISLDSFASIGGVYYNDEWNLSFSHSIHQVLHSQLYS